MYLSRFAKQVIIPQNILGLIAIAAPFFVDVSPFWILVAYIGWILIGALGVSTVFHKFYAHQAFEFRRQFRWLLPVLNYLGMLSGQGSAISYAAVHRCYHHKYADTSSLDPHSPKVHSFWHSYYGWHFQPITFSLKGVSHLLQDPFLVWTHRNYNKIYLVSLVAIGLIEWKLLLYGVIVPSLIHVHEMNILNSFSHLKKFGYRNFSIQDDSVNNWIFGILSWGTGFHNNHHAHPGAWHNQYRWFEFDPFRWILPIFAHVEPRPYPPLDRAVQKSSEVAAGQKCVS